MSLDLINNVWLEIKRHVPETDRVDAAETLINVLIDNDFDLDDIRDEFKRDNDVKRALQNHLDDHSEDEDEDEDYDDDYDYED